MTYEELRQEARRETFQKRLKNELGSRCVCCGSSEGIEYHHIVPLRLGGTNMLSNIAPLCGDCHVKAHGCVGMMGGRRGGGRPKRRAPEGYKDVLFKYVHGFIGRRECEDMLDIRGSKIYSAWYFKEYLKEQGIKKVKNHVDLLEWRGGDGEGRVVSEIWYYDGTQEDVVKDGNRRYFRISGTDVYSQPEQMTIWQAQ